MSLFHAIGKVELAHAFLSSIRLPQSTGLDLVTKGVFSVITSVHSVGSLVGVSKPLFLPIAVGRVVLVRGWVTTRHYLVG